MLLRIHQGIRDLTRSDQVQIVSSVDLKLQSSALRSQPPSLLLDPLEGGQVVWKWINPLQAIQQAMHLYKWCPHLGSNVG